MKLTVDEVRQKYSKLYESYTDQQIQDIIDMIYPLANLQADVYFDRLKYNRDRSNEIKSNTLRQSIRS